MFNANDMRLAARQYDPEVQRLPKFNKVRTYLSLFLTDLPDDMRKILSPHHLMFVTNDFDDNFAYTVHEVVDEVDVEDHIIDLYNDYKSLGFKHIYDSDNEYIYAGFEVPSRIIQNLKMSKYDQMYPEAYLDKFNQESKFIEQFILDSNLLNIELARMMKFFNKKCYSVCSNNDYYRQGLADYGIDLSTMASGQLEAILDERDYVF